MMLFMTRECGSPPDCEPATSTTGPVPPRYDAVMVRHVCRSRVPWSLLLGVPWVTLVGACSCPSYSREMKVTPDGLALVKSLREGDEPPPEVCETLCEGQAQPRQPQEGQRGMYWSCQVKHDGADTLVDCEGRKACMGGRRPHQSSLELAATHDHYFATLAELEGASVVAFLELAVALEAHGAPVAMVARVISSAREEVGHARLARDLAEARGVLPGQVELELGQVPSLEELATHNAREGLVSESFGALIALEQSRNAIDRDVRRTMALLGREELGHAALSRDIDAWARSRLGQRTSRRLTEARDEELARMVEAVGQEIERPERIDIGWPSAERAVSLAKSLSPHRAELQPMATL